MEHAAEAMDREILAYASRVLDRRGALVEEEEGSLVAILPPPLAEALELGEEVRFGPGGEPLLYGSPILNRLVQLAAAEPAVACGEVKVHYLKKEGFEARLHEDLVFADCRLHITQRAETRVPYLILACHYVALSDERKEGVARAAVAEESAALIGDFEEGLGLQEVAIYPRGHSSQVFKTVPERAIRLALLFCQRAVERELAGFLKTMARHLRRDVKNTREYYLAVEREMRASRETRAHTAEERRDRDAKISELSGELAAKIADLRQRYRVRVTLTPRTALRLLVPAVNLFVELKHRGLERRLLATYNPVTRKLDPFACERCGMSARKLVPRPAAGTVKLWCEACTGNPRATEAPPGSAGAGSRGRGIEQTH